MGLPPAPVVRANGQQPGIFALRARVWLQRNRVKAGDRAKLRFQIGEHLRIAGGLIGWGKWMNVGELRPGERHHLGRGIELHGAGAERDHAAVEREIAIRQTAHVTQQLGLGAIAMEDGVGEEFALRDAKSNRDDIAVSLESSLNESSFADAP